MKLLLEGVAECNVRDRTGQTPLHYAVNTGSWTAVQMLLNKGADARIEDIDGRKPHSIAEETFHHATAKILREHESNLYGYEVLPDFKNIPTTSYSDPQPDPAILDVLNVDANMVLIEPYGQASSTTLSKITVTSKGKTSIYFMKVGPDAAMLAGEYDSLTAIHKTVPSLCPAR